MSIIMQLIRAYATVGLYFFTIFLISILITWGITIFFNMIGNSMAAVIIELIVISVIAAIDFILLFRRSITPVMIIWAVPLLIGSLIHALTHKQRYVTYDLQAPVRAMQKKLHLICTLGFTGQAS